MRAWVDWKHLPKPRGCPDHRQHLPLAVAGCHPFSIFCLLGSHEKPVTDKTARFETGFCSFSWCKLPEEESACLSSHISFCVSHSHLSASLTSWSFPHKCKKRFSLVIDQLQPGSTNSKHFSCQLSFSRNCLSHTKIYEQNKNDTVLVSSLCSQWDDYMALFCSLLFPKII